MRNGRQSERMDSGSSLPVGRQVRNDNGKEEEGLQCRQEAGGRAPTSFERETLGFPFAYVPTSPGLAPFPARESQ